MKSKTKVRLAAGAMMLSLSGPAFAQPTQINTGNLVSALNNVNVEIDQLNVLNDLTITDVQVVNVEDSVNNNRVLNNVLNNNDVDIDDVVAIDVLRNGDVVLSVDVLQGSRRSDIWGAGAFNPGPLVFRFWLQF
jgi:archaellum biogenesis ATPase FlaH